ISSCVYEHGEYLPLDAARREQLLALAESYNKEGFRVLAIGKKYISTEAQKAQYAVADETELTLCGFLTFLDPPKDSAAQAIAA
ncbi:hypothetical protein H3V04_09845, partial [Bifidobacterium sp. M0353]|nr:hypothetical protein [Bifidobacterium sp. M0353]